MLRFRPILMTTMAALFGAVPRWQLVQAWDRSCAGHWEFRLSAACSSARLLRSTLRPSFICSVDNLRLKLQGDPHAELFTPSEPPI